MSDAPSTPASRLAQEVRVRDIAEVSNFARQLTVWLNSFERTPANSLAFETAEKAIDDFQRWAIIALKQQ